MQQLNGMHQAGAASRLLLDRSAREAQFEPDLEGGANVLAGGGLRHVGLVGGDCIDHLTVFGRDSAPRRAPQAWSRNAALAAATASSTTGPSLSVYWPTISTMFDG